MSSGETDDDRRGNAFGLLTSLHMLLESLGGFEYSGPQCPPGLHHVDLTDPTAEK